MLAVKMFVELGCEAIEAGSSPEALDRLSERSDVHSLRSKDSDLAMRAGLPRQPEL